MSTRAQIIAYIEDLARRNVNIAHRPAGTREQKRFFLWASNDALQGNYALNNTGWNLLLDLLPGTIQDNKADTEWRRPRIALDLVKQVKAQDAAAEATTIAAAEDILEDFFRRMRQHARNPCAATTLSQISSGITPPNAVLWETRRFVELSPLIFIGDRHFGMRYEVDLRYDTPNTDSDDANWGAPAS